MIAAAGDNIEAATAVGVVGVVGVVCIAGVVAAVVATGKFPSKMRLTRPPAENKCPPADIAIVSDGDADGLAVVSDDVDFVLSFPPI